MFVGEGHVSWCAMIACVEKLVCREGYRNRLVVVYKGSAAELVIENSGVKKA